MRSTENLNVDSAEVFETAAAETTRTILLIDDTDASHITTKWFLTNFGYTVETAVSAEQALLIFSPRTHDLVVTDNFMPGMNGAELAHIIKLRSPGTPVLMYTGTPPLDDDSCLDLVLERTGHLLQLKEAIDKLLGEKTNGVMENGTE